MNPNRIAAVLSISFIFLLSLLTPARTGAQQGEPQPPGAVDALFGTAFTYQGRLMVTGAPANGSYDFRFYLWDDALKTTLLGTYPTSGTVAINVVDGYFTVVIDFGVGIFNGSERWLEIEVNGTQLAPLQNITPTPYAIYAKTAPWSGLVGVPAGFADGVDNDTTTFWSLTGNSDTNPTKNYVGTNDKEKLVLRVNSIPALWLEPTSGTPNIIGGSSSNNVTTGVTGAIISGGGSNTYPNLVTDHYGTVGGGLRNQAGDNAGGINDHEFATVGGGYDNISKGSYSMIGGGHFNTAIGSYSMIGGGYSNIASGSYSMVGGGYGNTASMDYSTVGGGYVNDASGSYSMVGGGYYNNASGNYSTVGGGYVNDATGYRSTVSGGYSNTASGSDSTISGGDDNTASGSVSTISGGGANVASGDISTISGGSFNYASMDYSTVSGGTVNAANGLYSTVSGGVCNTANADYATIGGGGDQECILGNLVTDNWGTVSGGIGNQAGDNAGDIDDHEFATVSGGILNTASGEESTVGGGYANISSGSYSKVGGGNHNTASGNYATVGGGVSNTASGNYATVGGGGNNTASGADSFAAGSYAFATHHGSFVWSSWSVTDSWGNNTFTARSHGGVRFYTASGTSTGVQLASGGGSWGSLSDRNMKHNIIPVNTLAVLEELADLPISTWSYTSQDDSIRHMGPMSQDFYASFGLGEDERYIGTLDAEGVALAAIQGLYQVNQEQAKQVEQIKKENAQLLKENETLNAQLESLGSRLDALEGGDHPQRDSLYGILIGALLIGLIGWGAPKLSRRFS